MYIRVKKEDILRISTPALVVNLFEGVKKPGGATSVIDKSLEGIITQLIEDGEVTGKKGEITLIHTFGRIGPSRILIAGLGNSSSFDLEVIRRVFADSCRYLRKLGVREISTIAHGAGIGAIDAKSVGRSIAEGAILGLYRFNNYLTKNDSSKTDIEEITIVEQDGTKISDLEDGIKTGEVIARATMLARDMVNEPANVMTPIRMAECATKIAEDSGLDIEILGPQDMEERNMGAILGVSKGSHQPPRLIVLKYNGDPKTPSNNIAFVGKGITFDTGGISIKPAGGMEDMKGDMAGGAAVIAAMGAIGSLRPKINAFGIIAAVENMPGGSAQRPGDVVKSMSGKTIEVINTDAEGRLVLADALYFTQTMGINKIVDVATLTGAMVVALGNVCSGVMGNNQDLIDQLIQSGSSTGERIWQLPMHDEYKEQIKSQVADIKNVGSGRGAGSITAAQFLSEFIEDTSWAHLDIAGTYMNNKDRGYQVKGGSGVPTRSLVALALKLANGNAS